MKTLVLTAALLVVVPAAAQDSQMKPPSPEEMQKMMALMGPGPEHKGFETLVGSWDMNATYSMGSVESLSIYGFDRRTNEYTVVGYDTMGTYYVTAAGKREAGANEVVMQGEIEEHGDVKKYDMVLRWADADTHVTEIIFHMPDGELKIAEMTFTRVK